ncbi:hypothetical protein QUF70_15055, partial [Desulfobacterales bacterium HSG17]|nr:hypothetical protein [Desulfobacterales bacterium HSG17]
MSSEEIKKKDPIETVSIQDIKAALDDSSGKNRAMFVSFMVFEVYMFITIGAVSDLQLLVPGSEIHLPLINMNIPLFGFFIIAPMFLLAVHFNLLFNLFLHSQKLFSWGELVGPAEKRSLLQPFLFNYLIRFEPGQINFYVLRVILYTLVYFGPLALLTYTQYKFSRYHDPCMTLWHLFTVILDLFYLLFYWPRILNPGTIDDEHEDPAEFFKFIVSFFPTAWKIFTASVPFLVLSAAVFWIIQSEPDSLKLSNTFTLLLLFTLPVYLTIVFWDWKELKCQRFFKIIWIITWKNLIFLPSLLIFSFYIAERLSVFGGFVLPAIVIIWLLCIYPPYIIVILRNWQHKGHINILWTCIWKFLLFSLPFVISLSPLIFITDPKLFGYISVLLFLNPLYPYFLLAFLAYPLLAFLAYLFLILKEWEVIKSQHFIKRAWTVIWKALLLLPVWKFFLWIYTKSKTPKANCKQLCKKMSSGILLVNYSVQKTNYPFIFKTIMCFIAITNFLLILFLPIYDLFPTKYITPVLPHLEITETTLVAREPGETIMTYLLKNNINKESK